MSNRTLKLRLWQENPHCHWCKRKTKLICLDRIVGEADPLTATLDHVISKYHPGRWIRKPKNTRRKVLSCYECNHNRSVQETLCLSRAEILNRSKGFSFSPKGKPPIIKPVENIRIALDKLSIRQNKD